MQTKIPCVIMRGGTSRGPFFKLSDLPADIPTRDRSLIGAWIAIDDANIENGCLWVIPGSHRNGYLYQVDPRTFLVQRAVSALLR